MSALPDDQLSEQPQTFSSSTEIDPFKFQNFMQQAKSRQNFSLGFIGGLGAALLAAIIWTVITIITDYQIGWMAVGVGFLVGWTVRQVGQGIDKSFGFMGAALALFGCLVGNLLTVTVVLSRQEDVSLLNVLLFLISSPGLVIEIMIATFSPMDLLFYGIAIYEGYKFAFRRFSRAELASLMK